MEGPVAADVEAARARLARLSADATHTWLITDSQRARIKALFRAIDHSGDGAIQLNELSEYLGGDKKSAMLIIFDMDENFDREIDEDEFNHFYDRIAHHEGEEAFETELARSEECLAARLAENEPPAPAPQPAPQPARSPRGRGAEGPAPAPPRQREAQAPPPTQSPPKQFGKAMDNSRRNIIVDEGVHRDDVGPPSPNHRQSFKKMERSSHD
jgi:hypothetical protein